MPMRQASAAENSFLYSLALVAIFVNDWISTHCSIIFGMMREVAAVATYWDWDFGIRQH